MTGWSLVIAAGLVNHLVTTIVCESELVRPVRDYTGRRRHPEGPLGHDHDGRVWAEVAPGFFARYDRQPWRWLDYMVRCHLCVGVWVGIAEALYIGPIVGRGFAGFVFTALLIKAVGHLVLELRPQAWPL